MSTYLISYDLGGPENSGDYKKVIDCIKNLGNWAKPLESLFLVVSEKGAGEIRDIVGGVTDNNDKILVIDITERTWGTSRMEKEITDWMNLYVKNYN